MELDTIVFERRNFTTQVIAFSWRLSNQYSAGCRELARSFVSFFLFLLSTMFEESQINLIYERINVEAFSISSQ